MVKLRSRPIVAAVVAVTALGGTALATAAPAEAATAPAPICVSSRLSPTGEYCVPQYWLTVTNVVTNDGLLRLDAVSFTNNSTETSTVTQTETITGSLTAGLSVAVPINSDQVAATLTPSFSGTILGSVAVAGSAAVPPQCVGTLYFGIQYVMADVLVYTRNILGEVSSRPALAWSPMDFGYSDGFQIPVPGPTPPNAACAAAAAVQPVVPTPLQFAEIVLAGPTGS
jgi:hypothetical protein